MSFRTEGGPAATQIVTMGILWLVAFLALACMTQASPVAAFALLAGGYTAVLVLDPIAARSGLAPLFFAKLRPPQMMIAVLALAALLADSALRS